MYCRSSKKLAGRLVQNSEADWVRKDDAYEPVVSPDLFRAVAARRVAMRQQETRDDLLAQVRRLLKEKGRLSAPLLYAAPGILSSHGFARRFGGLTALYREAGFVPERNPRYAFIRRWLTHWRESLTTFAVRQLEAAGSSVVREGWHLTVDDAWTVSFMVVHGSRPVGARQQWFNHRKAENTDVVVFARCVFAEPGPRDYFVLPRVLFPTWPSCIYTRNDPLLESCRYPSLAILGDLARLSREDNQLCG